MGLFRNFFDKNKRDVKSNRHNVLVLDDKGRGHIAMHSTIFADVQETLLASNSMFSDLLQDIEPCVEPYSTKEKITMDVYETKPSDEFSRDTTIIGFRKYVHACFNGLRKQHISRFFLFFSFLIIGIVIELLLYGIIGQDLPNKYFWMFKSAEVLGTLFIWQFGGYMAFEFLGETKQLKRYKQIEEIEFEFKHWD